jgi:hypothetical protein
MAPSSRKLGRAAVAVLVTRLPLLAPRPEAEASSLAAAGRVATGRVAADTVSMRKAAIMARRRIELVFIFVVACYVFVVRMFVLIFCEESVGIITSKNQAISRLLSKTRIFHSEGFESGEFLLR